MAERNGPARAEWITAALAEHEGALVRYAARLLGDTEAARDVVQETFLQLCREPPAVLNGRLGPWLYTVCRSRALDARRKSRRRREVDDAAFVVQASGEAGPPERVTGREDARRIMAAMSKLSVNQQEIVWLRFRAGLRYKEIAGVTGLSVTNVGYLIHTALQRIRDEVAGSD